ncbi:MAG: DegV family protein [Actinobacteria bacterium]|nr:DegV family protein [Actinomycetota bacterium]
MKNITIVIDSTSDLPRNIYKGYDLSVVPLSVVFGAKTYLDDGISYVGNSLL